MSYSYKTRGAQSARLAHVGVRYDSSRVLRALGRLPKVVRRGALVALKEMADITLKALRDIVLSGSRTGKVYRKKGRVHTASAAGEPPANDEGTLVQSMFADVEETSLTMDAGASAQHAGYLEFGTKDMEPRPFIRVVRALLTGRYIEIMKDKISQAVRGAFG